MKSYIVYLGIIVICAVATLTHFACEEQDRPLDAVIDTTIYDAKINVQSIARSGDGWYDIIIEGSDYKGKNGLELFLFDANFAKATLLDMLVKFDPANQVDTFKIRWYYKNVSQNMNCNDNTGLNEGVSCDFDKIKRAADDVANGKFTPNHIMVLMNGKYHAGSDGALVSDIGFGQHVSNPTVCPSFYQGAGGYIQHEFLHSFVGMGHVLLPDNKNGSCTNGCCFILAAPVLPQHQVLVKARFDGIVN